MDAFTDRLSDYLDGELDDTGRAAVDRHLSTCLTCRRTLDELRAVVARARALTDAGPDADLWPGVAARLDDRRQEPPLIRRAAWSRRFSFSLTELAAASLALMVLGGSLVWLARSGDPRADFAPVSASDRVDGPVLDDATTRVLSESLRAIDRAIDESQRALDADPANARLARHLADIRRDKLALEQRVETLTSTGR